MAICLLCITGTISNPTQGFQFKLDMPDISLTPRLDSSRPDFEACSCSKHKHSFHIAVFIGRPRLFVCFTGETAMKKLIWCESHMAMGQNPVPNPNPH